MTSDDELLKRLDNMTFEAFDDAPMQCEATVRQAAARIRELEAERDEAVTQMVEAKMERDKAQERISELEAELKKQTIRTEFWKQKALLAQPGAK